MIGIRAGGGGVTFVRRNSKRLPAGTVAIVFVAFLVSYSGYAHSEEAEEPASETFDEALDELPIDVLGSISDATQRLGLSINGDLRAGYTFAGDDFDAARLGDSGVLRARWRSVRWYALHCADRTPDRRASIRG